MRTHPLRPNLVLVLACLLAILLFLLGIVVPQAHFWGNFLLPIVLVFLWGRRRDIYLVTALASVLVVATYWTDGAAALADFVTYHLLPLIILWGAAWLLAQRQQLQEQLARSQQELEAQVTARTAELKTSEQRYRLIAEHAGDLIWTVDMDGSITYASPAAQRLRGVTGAEEQSASWFDRMPPEVAARAAAALQADLAALGAGQPIDATPRAAPAYRKDGTLVWTETVMSPIYDEEGRPLGLCGSTRDITERKQLEARANHLAALVDAAADAITSATVDGTILTMNRSAEALYGIAAAATVGQNIATIVPPELRDNLPAAIAHNVGGAIITVDDVAWRRPDGDTRILSLSLAPVYDGAGQVTALSAIARDITARKAAEREHLFLSALVTSSPDAVVGRMVDGTILSWNRGAEQLFGYTAEEAVGRNLSMLAAPDGLAQLQADMDAVAQGEPVEDVETQRMAKDGRVFDCVVSLFPVRAGGGEILGVASFTRDISRRKAAELALRDSEERFRLIVQNSPDIIALYNERGQLTYISPTIKSTHGFTAEQAVTVDPLLLEAMVTPPGSGPRADELARVRAGRHFADRRKTAETVAYCLEHPGLQERVEISNTHASGEVRYFDVAYRAHLRADGSRQVVSIARDITERKRLEDALRRSEQKWRSVFKFLPLGLSVVDGKDKVTDCNPALAQILDMTPEGILAGRYAQRRYFHTDMSPMSGDEFPSQRALREGQVVRDVVIGVEKEDGELIWLSVSATPESIDGYALTVTTDITALKRADAERLALAERWNMAAQMSSIGVWDWHAGSNELLWDERMYLLHGIAPGTAMTFAAWRTLIHPDDRAAVEANSRKSGVERTRNPVEYRVLLPDGSVRHILSVGGGLYDAAGTPVRQLGVSMDISERKQIEEALAKSERKYRDLYNNSPDMYLSGYPADHLIRDCNQTLARTLGYTREELIGRPTSIVLTPYSYSRVQAELPKYLAAGAYTNLDVQMQCKDGTILDALLSGRIDPATADHPVTSHVIFRDITARRRLEEQLRESEARLRAVIENTADNIWSLDRNYCFLVGNAAFARAMEQEIGRPLAVGECLLDEPFSPSGCALWQPLYDRALRGESFMFETPSVLRAGGTLACYLNPIYAADDTIVGVSARAADITDIKQAETQLRVAYQRLQLATDAAAIGIWNWNFADNELEWDDRVCEMYAVTGEERRVGISYDFWRARVHPDDLVLMEPAQGDPSRMGGQWSGTYRIVQPGGAIRYIQASSVTQHDHDGKPQHMIGINRDITDQMHYQQLLQDANAVLEQRVAARTAELQAAFAELARAGRLKDEFMAMMSHELRTPLAGVLSMSEMLEDQVAGPLNDRQATYVKSIVHSGERLLNVINGILSYTHLLSGKVQLEAEPCDLANLLIICAASQQHKAAAKEQSIAVQVDPPELVVVSDAAALAEVLKRLLDNAVKFTPHGGRIGLEAHQGAAPHTVDLVVWDTGIGIAADQLENVFHAFVQADARLSRSHEGIGIGLAYVDQMVHQMGGTIALMSTPGEGSRFTVTLPA